MADSTERGLPPRLQIDPRLVNSANPWATTLEDLQKLYDSPYVGAVTTRTSLIHGFDHDPKVHLYALCDTTVREPHQIPSAEEGGTEGDRQAAAATSDTAVASFNSLGYSPIILAEYLSFIKTIAGRSTTPGKGFIVSVTGSPREVAECYALVASAQRDVAVPLAVEVNMSCPNIPDKPPPAYDGAAILEYVGWLVDVDVDVDGGAGRRVPLGIKTPPYTYSTQYATLIEALLASAARAPGGRCPVSFITATNTLGSCLGMALPSAGGSGGGEAAQVLPGTGIGGMAGAPLHHLALGNVATIRRLLDEHPAELGHVQVIGVGGVSDADGYRRMRSVGADVVGVGTALLAKGVGVFEEIAKGPNKG